MTRSDEPVTRASRRQWWQDLRWITAGVVAGIVALLAWGLFGPEPPLKVARNTTFLTAPLAADGLPDYRAALLAAMGPAPKPEENAAVELLQVMWPLKLEAADLPVVCQALGIPAVPPAETLPSPTKDAAVRVTHEMLAAARERPWTGAEFPELEAWLVAHEAALNRLVAAADRPRYWLPSPAMLRPNLQEFMEYHPDDMFVRLVAEHLRCRAMWHVGSGRHAAAWRDIHAGYRFSRLLTMPPNATCSASVHLTQDGTGTMADRALTHALLGAPGLPADVLATIRRELDLIGPLPDLGDAFLDTERITMIEWLVTLAKRIPGGRAGRRQAFDFPVLGLAAGPPPSRSWLATLRQSFGTSDQAAVSTSLEWDVALERVNAYIDSVVAAARRSTHMTRQAELKRLEADLCRSRNGPGWGGVGHVVCGIGSRKYRSAFVGVGSIWIYSDHFEVRTRSRASFDLTRTAAALAAWKADRAAGDESYPETLDALVPQYLPVVPLDPFSDTPFIYERRGDGYLLASVGKNGVYDGGDGRDGWIVGGEWRATSQDVDRDKSDIVVRMPVPPRPVAP
jgi:hypothetical protein